MLLAIDTGNTNTVFAVFKGDVLLKSWRLRTESARCADEYAAQINQLFELAGLNFKKIKQVIISSVVPESDFHLNQFCTEYLGLTPVFITKDHVPVEIDLPHPEDVGADRLVNAAAIIAHYQTPAIVIDFGTATTFDVIDAKGRYSGGVIAPGINLSLNALHQAASKLPKVNIEKPKNVTGKTTAQAMQSGLYWGYVGLIDGLLKRLSAEMTQKPFILATGGLADLFIKDISVIDSVDQDLTLKGLYQIHKFLNQKKP